MYALVNDTTDVVESQSGQFVPGAMGPFPPPPTIPGYTAHLLTQPLPWSNRPSEAHWLKWREGDLVWELAASLAQLQASAIARTYVDVDAVYAAAVGNRTVEYTKAEAAARAYLTAEVKPSPASSFVTGHALNNPTGQVQSEAWAAQQIVEKADAFSWAVGHMRDVRFARQADMRAATTPEELAAAVASWANFITWLRATLDL